jgi:type I restriction enzyme M protein
MGLGADLNSDLQQKLDQIATVLRSVGLTGPSAFEQLSLLMYLKMLDELESMPAGDAVLFPLQAERFRWSNWCLMSGPSLVPFLRDEVLPYMASLAREAPQVGEYFKDSALEIRDPGVLENVVRTIHGIDFTKLGISTTGEILEYLLSQLSGPETEYRTPTAIRKLMVQLLDPDFNETLYDPACGTAGFLVDAAEHIVAKYSPWPQPTSLEGDPVRQRDFDAIGDCFYANDVNRQCIRISMMNLFLHGIRNAHVKRANVLSASGGLNDDDMGREYDVVLCNPPFAGLLPKEGIRADLPVVSKRADLLFLALVMRSLRRGGRCAVIVPESLLSGSAGASVDLRRTLVEDFAVRAVISLPKQALFSTLAKVAILVFGRPKTTDHFPRSRKIWFYRIHSEEYVSRRPAQGVYQRQNELATFPVLLQKWVDFKASGFQDPPGPEAGTDLPSHSEPSRFWWAPVGLVASFNYSLSPSRYAPEVSDEIDNREPSDLIGDVLRMEEDISRRLKHVLRKVETLL